MIVCDCVQNQTISLDQRAIASGVHYDSIWACIGSIALLVKSLTVDESRYKINWINL